MESTRARGSLREYLAACRTLPERDRRNVRTANWILFAWAVSLGVCLFSLSRGVVPEGALTVAAVVVPTLLSVLGVLAFARFLRHADELHRKIQYEALAVGFGAGFVTNFALELAEEAGWGTFDAGDPFFVMVLFYIAGVVAATRRYL